MGSKKLLCVLNSTHLFYELKAMIESITENCNNPNMAVMYPCIVSVEAYEANTAT